MISTGLPFFSEWKLMLLLLTSTLVLTSFPSNDGVPLIFDISRRDLSDSLYAKCVAPVNPTKHPDESVMQIHDEQLNTIKTFIHKNRCNHLYLDIGTNVGVSLRKLYEPKLYPKAELIPYFDKNFGPMDKRDHVCSVGFEPNSKHAKRLIELQQVYQKMGWPMVIFTTTGVATSDGTLTINRVSNDKDVSHKEMGAGVFHGADHQEEVIALDISHFLHKIVKLWEGANYKKHTSRILAKMDIEGSEFSVIPHMLQEGSLCLINEITIEYHHIYTGNIMWK